MKQSILLPLLPLFFFRALSAQKVGDTSLVSVNDLAEDDRGFLWLGGLYGLYI